MSITNSLKLLQKFSSVSGLKLNIDKCQGLWLGEFKANSTSFEGIQFVTCPIKCLGIYIGTDFKECEKQNWNKKITSIEQMLMKWNSRTLTIYGKVTVINCLAIPKLIYNMSLLPVPQYVIDKLKKIIFQYLWGKSHKIKRNTVIGKIEQGGLNITDIELKICAVKTSWIRKFLTAKNLLSDMVQYYISKIGVEIKTLLKMNFQSSNTFNVIKNIPQFYQDIFISFNKCKTLKPFTQLKVHEIMTQVIWGNEYFTHKGRTLYYKHWITSGFILVKDLFDESGSLLTERCILQKLQVTSNWIAELSILKKVLGCITNKVHTKVVKYIQKSMEEKVIFLGNDISLNTEPLKAKSIYNVLMTKHYQRPYTEKLWERILNVKILESEWSKIYNSNLKFQKLKKFAEFKYKILMDILPCGEKLKKWEKSDQDACSVCLRKENTLHLLYDCHRVKDIWREIGKCLNLNIQPKHIVLGLTDEHYVEINRHLCIIIVAFSIYSIWCKCSFEKLNYSNVNLRSSIEYNLEFYLEVFLSVMHDFAQKKHWKNVMTSILHIFKK